MNDNNPYLDVIEKTYKLSQKIADLDILYKIKNLGNKGKRIEMGVSSTLILDTFNAFKELKEKICDPNYKESKIAISLLIRYIHESYINFLYIFTASKGQRQIRTKAFFYFGEFIRKKITGDPTVQTAEKEWSKYVVKNPKKGSWHGKTFKEISDELKHESPIYRTLSQFTHPGIFTMERILDTDMFEGILEDGSFFTSASVCNIMVHANNKKLYGIKNLKNNDSEIQDLVNVHDAIVKKFSKRLKNNI